MERLEQAKQVMGDWLRMKERECERRVKQVREFLRKNGLADWATHNFPPTLHRSDPITVYDRTLKVVGVFGEIQTSDYLSSKDMSPQSEGVDGLMYVFVVSTYGWVQFWLERAGAMPSNPYGLNSALPHLLSLNSPNLIKVVGEMLDEGARWWEMVKERALEVIERQLDAQSQALDEMVIDLQLAR